MPSPIDLRKLQMLRSGLVARGGVSAPGASVSTFGLAFPTLAELVAEGQPNKRQATEQPETEEDEGKSDE